MSKSMLQLVKETLREDGRLSSEGKLLRNKIMELTHKQDEELIDLLLSNERIKEHFFSEVNGTLVFDKDEFINFVNNKQFLPDSYTTFKNKIGLTSDGEHLDKKKDVALAWPYKDCVLEGEQVDPDEDREEVFWNEILAPDEINRLLDPKVLTNFKRVDGEGEHKNPELRYEDNLIIRGNNLLALHSLKERFRNKVKLIYIDPPYNTGNDAFRYNDRFNHSSWLTFIKNRLEIAKELLSEKGLIFINIDDNEQAYLSVLCDEIFGKENAFDKISVKTSSSQGGFGWVNPGPISNTENILVYSKDPENFEFNKKKMYMEKEYDTNYDKIITNPEKEPENWEYTKLDYLVYEEAGIEKPYNSQTWRKLKDKWGEAWKELRKQRKAEIALENRDRVFRTYNPNKPADYLEEALEKSKNKDRVVVAEAPKSGEKKLCLNGELIIFYGEICKKINGKVVPAKRLTTFWDDIAWEGISREGGVKLRSGKKPEKLLKRIIEIGSEEKDLVLDFFTGTGTSATVTHKMNRRYIGIEQLDYGENDPTVRLKNVIDGDRTGISDKVDWDRGGSFVYCELMKWNQKYIDKIKEADAESELLEIWREMKEEAFLSYKLDPQKFDENVDEFKELSLEDQKKFLMECLDKNHLYVNLSEIDDEEYNISEEDKQMNKQFYEGL